MKKVQCSELFEQMKSQMKNDDDIIQFVYVIETTTFYPCNFKRVNFQVLDTSKTSKRQKKIVLKH